MLRKTAQKKHHRGPDRKKNRGEKTFPRASTTPPMHYDGAMIGELGGKLAECGRLMRTPDADAGAGGAARGA